VAVTSHCLRITSETCLCSKESDRPAAGSPRSGGSGPLMSSPSAWHAVAAVVPWRPIPAVLGLSRRHRRGRCPAAGYLQDDTLRNCCWSHPAGQDPTHHKGGSGRHVAAVADVSPVSRCCCRWSGRPSPNRANGSTSPTMYEAFGVPKSHRAYHVGPRCIIRALEPSCPCS